MGTPAKEFDPVTFVLGGERVIDQQLTAKQSLTLLDATITRLKPLWKELPFKEGYEHQAESVFGLNGCPEDFLKVRFLRVYGGQEFHRSGVHGFVTYYVTRGRKWLRMFTSRESSDDVYRFHEWLGKSDMEKVLAEDPSLLKCLIGGFGKQSRGAANALRTRAERFDRACESLRELEDRLDMLNQPWPRDLPTSTHRLLT